MILAMNIAHYVVRHLISALAGPTFLFAFPLKYFSQIPFSPQILK